MSERFQECILVSLSLNDRETVFDRLPVNKAYGCMYTVLITAEIFLCFVWICAQYTINSILLEPVGSDLTGNLISYPHRRETKYFIASGFRLEGYYIEEWIKYHLALGFDGIYLCDNNRDDEDLVYIEQIRAQFPQVEIINKRNLPCRQEEWFVEMYEKIRPGDWCFFIDADEFVTFAPNMSLYYYISLAQQTPCQQIKMNWLLFGNNKEIFWRPGSTFERFPKPLAPVNGTPAEVPHNTFVKPMIVGGLRIRFPLMHYAMGRFYGCRSDFVHVANREMWVGPVFQYVYLRHYQTRSEQEYCMKMQRWKGQSKYAKDYKWERYDQFNVYPGNQVYTGIIGGDCNVSSKYQALLNRMEKKM